MLNRLRRLLNQINTASAAEQQGRALLARIDAEAALMTATLQTAARHLTATDAETTAILRVARFRLLALREAAITARALRPEHIQYSGAAACLCDGTNIAPLLARLAGVAPKAQITAQVA